MGLINTTSQYGSVAKWIHWLTALCFLFAYITIHYSHRLEFRSPEYLNVVFIHASLGITVGLLFLPRLIWRMKNVEPLADPAPHWQHLAAKCAHWALYFALIAMPLTGWFGLGIPSFKFYGLFDVPSFLGTGIFESSFVTNMGLTFEEWEAPLDYFHKNIMGQKVLWVLILVHAGAALYHHFAMKDNTLKRMWPGGKPDQSQ